MTRNASRLAWEKIQDGNLLTGQRWRVYDWLFLHGPATAGEVTNALRTAKQPHGNYHVRLSELLDRGVVERGPERKCHVTGNMAAAWDVTDKLPRSPVVNPERLLARGAELLRRSDAMRTKAHAILARAVELGTHPLPNVDAPAGPC